MIQGGGDELDNEDRDFLSQHIRKGTKKSYNSGWLQFSTFCKTRKVEPLVASEATIVKFIKQMFMAGHQYRTMNVAVSAISKFHVRLSSGLTIAYLPLVQQAKKSFWQLRPPIPKYQTTYDACRVLKYISDLGENDTLGTKVLSHKTAFLVAFATLSRYRVLYWLADAAAGIAQY